MVIFCANSRADARAEQGAPLRARRGLSGRAGLAGRVTGQVQRNAGLGCCGSVGRSAVLFAIISGGSGTPGGLGRDVVPWSAGRAERQYLAVAAPSPGGTGA